MGIEKIITTLKQLVDDENETGETLIDYHYKDAVWGIINAYANLKAEADNLRACVKAADDVRSAVFSWNMTPYLAAYDAARAKVKP